MTNNLEQVEKYARAVMGAEAAHNFSHVDRVRNWAIKIALANDFSDLESVEIAALLHDIGLSQAEKRSLHGEVGAIMAAQFLEKSQILSLEKIFEVCNAIKFHNKNREGAGRLLDIIRDADMMDLFGTIGIMRAFMSKATYQEYDETNIKGETWKMTASDFDKRFDSGIGIGQYIVDQINFQISCYDNLSTDSAKLLAQPLIKTMQDFLIQLEQEVNLKI